jgi:hypothetical protein
MGIYINPIPNHYLNLSGGTVSGNTYFSADLSASTIFSGSTDLKDVIINLIYDNIIEAGLFLPLSGGTGGEYEFTGNTTANTIDLRGNIIPVNDNVSYIGEGDKRINYIYSYKGDFSFLTASTNINTIEILLGGLSITKNNIVLSGDVIFGGTW